jgi:hypothetical protein
MTFLANGSYYNDKYDRFSLLIYKDKVMFKCMDIKEKITNFNLLKLNKVDFLENVNKIIENQRVYNKGIQHDFINTFSICTFCDYYKVDEVCYLDCPASLDFFKKEETFLKLFSTLESEYEQLKEK